MPVKSPARLIAPSILSADFARLGEEVEAVLAAGADVIHFDVMDNHYVPNLTIGPLVCEALRKRGIKAPIDVHLMVQPVDELARAFAGAGASWISFHPEATRHVDRTISLIRELGCRPGLALNPATPLDCLDYTLPLLDLVLVMSVNPGFGGQAFIPGSLPKLRAVRERIAALGRPVMVQVDGGIKADNIRRVAEAGADVFVAGSAIFGSSDYAATIRRMREELAATAHP
ncbi:MAG: ribulose-phosphate 3-epimerase [Gammaproteobacteria bacterium]|nr:ribulose-phosphate 3-epimerase [Gammaproteobacteria bacterium]